MNPDRMDSPKFSATSFCAVTAALGILILAVFSNSFTAQFTMDSRYLVGIDSRVHHLNWDSLYAIVSTDYWYPLWNSHLYRPLTTASYLLNYSLAGGHNPMPYHVVNCLLHWVNTTLVFLLASTLFDRRIYAFLTAAIFAVHPITTEAVTYIAGRAD